MPNATLPTLPEGGRHRVKEEPSAWRRFCSFWREVILRVVGHL